ncbi:MAG TPA: peptidyl-prolyl cis-trans isomerase [Nanoarchaeota archaeon]|nr:peptidyl-prolyl cis-trans isomerase [Nanoarchaeota archaeon]
MKVAIKKSILKKILYPFLDESLSTGFIFLFLPQSAQHKVLIETNYGKITLQLDSSKAPITVKNFEDYVKSGFYDGTVFHRIIKGFMIQGGGFAIDGTQKQTNVPIVLESNNGLKNIRYSIAMARTNDPNSATSQFFINAVDNSFLDYNAGNPGYAVFGRVIDGFETVDKIENLQTETKNGMSDWPTEEVIIQKVSLI